MKSKYIRALVLTLFISNSLHCNRIVDTVLAFSPTLLAAYCALTLQNHQTLLSARHRELLEKALCEGRLTNKEVRDEIRTIKRARTKARRKQFTTVVLGASCSLILAYKTLSRSASTSSLLDRKNKEAEEGVGLQLEQLAKGINHSDVRLYPETINMMLKPLNKKLRKQKKELIFDESCGEFHVISVRSVRKNRSSSNESISTTGSESSVSIEEVLQEMDERRSSFLREDSALRALIDQLADECLTCKLSEERLRAESQRVSSVLRLSEQTRLNLKHKKLSALFLRDQHAMLQEVAQPKSLTVFAESVEELRCHLGLIQDQTLLLEKGDMMGFLEEWTRSNLHENHEALGVIKKKLISGKYLSDEDSFQRLCGLLCEEGA